VKRAEFDASFKSTEMEFGATPGFPAGPEIFYECPVCHDVVPSLPLHAEACSCRNLIVDVDAGRVSVKSGDRSISLVRGERILRK